MSGQTPAAVALPKNGEETRRVLDRAEQLRQKAAGLVGVERRAQLDVEQSFNELRTHMVEAQLAEIPVERLKESTSGRLRLGAIATAGFTTVLDVYKAGPDRLLRIQGVGQQTADQLRGAARQVAEAVKEGLKVRVDLDPANPRSTGLLVALRRLEITRAAVAPHSASILSVSTGLARHISSSQKATVGSLRWFFTGSDEKARARAAVAKTLEFLRWADATGYWQALDQLAATVSTPVAGRDVWKDFETRSAQYYGLLGEIVDLGLDVAASEGFLPAEIVKQVNEQQLDETFRNVSLRGYQAFGAKFALVQRRVIIGDEMGLGKTIQAIAAMAHLHAIGGTRYLVVCPASVLVNWLREIQSKSSLEVFRLHGDELWRNRLVWDKRGGVGVTTFEGLRTLDHESKIELDMLVVDEAHFVKNPNTIRSRTVRSLLRRSARTMFLTGTPMENRVEEFKNLISYLQPEVVQHMSGVKTIARAEVFRKAIAPVYLRRNQEDVLNELPDLIQVDEWEDFEGEDYGAYLDAVAAGNFMAMRRAAFAGAADGGSAKVRRLLEVVEEAAANGHKVIVFSFFRDVLEVVSRTLRMQTFPLEVIGALTGSVSTSERQNMVDRFTAAKGAAVLVSQIQAGGVGLNIQAASVVILCEPQVKPSMESQAIARAHRMGQVRSVQVHRLLIEDSVDQRMLEILGSKQALFDEYARQSDIAVNTPEAMDISEVALARDVVAAEQERLAKELMARLDADGNSTASLAEG
ncbi:SNF2-related protein [Arthrobacter sp. UYEF21]|uniref:DEAD/DEAH box helicase n=1 Tax=Arthrobacter sp. UYEF21 TaxID=1756364 RepID=UPI0033997960